jgi:SRSO17 transposase
MGFQVELVLADSLYGESKVNFVDVLDELKLPYILAIRSDHGLWLPEEEEVYQEPWQEFKRTFSITVVDNVSYFLIYLENSHV